MRPKVYRTLQPFWGNPKARVWLAFGLIAIVATFVLNVTKLRMRSMKNNLAKNMLVQNMDTASSIAKLDSDLNLSIFSQIQTVTIRTVNDFKIRDTKSMHVPRPRVCLLNASICSYSEDLISFALNRTRCATLYRRKRLAEVSRLGIHVHSSLTHRRGRHHWGLVSYYEEHCPTCRFENDPAHAHVHLYHYSQFPNIHEVQQRPNIIFSMFNMEAHSFERVSRDSNNSIIISYLSDSDIVVNYCCALGLIRRMCTAQIYALDAAGSAPPSRPQCGPPLANTHRAFYEWCRDRHGGDFFTCAFGFFPLLMEMGGVNRTGRRMAAAWVSATCDRHNNFLRELMRYMSVDMMGRCYRNRVESKHPGLRLPNLTKFWPGNTRAMTKGELKVLLGSHYRFYIGVENTVLDDYVTEKFFQGFLMDSVMVYFGAPNAALYAPAPHSFVNAVDFAGPFELAQFLQGLAADEARYVSYLAWKRGPVLLSEGYLRALRSSDVAEGYDSVPCRLCRMVSGMGERDTAAYLGPAGLAAADSETAAPSQARLAAPSLPASPEGRATELAQGGRAGGIPQTSSASSASTPGPILSAPQARPEGALSDASEGADGHRRNETVPRRIGWRKGGRGSHGS